MLAKFVSKNDETITVVEADNGDMVITSNGETRVMGKLKKEYFIGNKDWKDVSESLGGEVKHLQETTPPLPTVEDPAV